MLSPSAAPGSPLSNMLRYMYAITRFGRSVLEFSYCSKKWFTFGAFRVNQKALGAPDPGMPGLVERIETLANHTGAPARCLQHGKLIHILAKLTHNIQEF